MSTTFPSSAERSVLLASATDKTGLLPFVRGVEQIQKTNGRVLLTLSTGGTYDVLQDNWNGVDVTEVQKHTWFPEMMKGRLKTLHPTVHGGFLWRLDNTQDLEDMAKHKIIPIDMAVVNLYDFDGTVAKYEAGKATFAEVIENIDIGGPSMLRSAAKWAKVVIADPKDYDDVLGDMDLHQWGLTTKLQAKLQAKVFRATASYDTKISRFLDEHLSELEAYFDDLNKRIAAMN